MLHSFTALRMGARAATGALLLVASTIAACSDSGPGSVDPTDYVGTWELQIAAEPDCWQAFTLRFTIDQVDADRASDEVINVVADWWFDGNPSQRFNISGNINWLEDDFRLLFFKSSGNSAEFRGTGSDSDQLDGIFDDSDLVFAPTFDPGPCIGDASASHVSTTVE